jgi:hypothetical protein
LFAVKQTYIFAVFEKTLLNDQGKAYVPEYEKQSDAQSIYRRIVSEYAIKSTKASLEASMILSYITSCKLGEGSVWSATLALCWIMMVNRCSLCPSCSFNQQITAVPSSISKN